MAQNEIDSFVPGISPKTIKRIIKAGMINHITPILQIVKESLLRMSSKLFVQPLKSSTIQ